MGRAVTPQPVAALHYETDDMSRVRAHLAATYGMSDEDFDALKQGYNIITNTKRQLGITT